MIVIFFLVLRKNLAYWWIVTWKCTIEISVLEGIINFANPLSTWKYHLFTLWPNFSDRERKRSWWKRFWQRFWYVSHLKGKRDKWVLPTLRSQVPIQTIFNTDKIYFVPHRNWKTDKDRSLAEITTWSLFMENNFFCLPDICFTLHYTIYEKS